MNTEKSPGDMRGFTVTQAPIKGNQLTFVGKKLTMNNNDNNRNNNPNYIAEIGQNTEQSPRDLRRFAVPQAPIKNHQQMLV